MPAELRAAAPLRAACACMLTCKLSRVAGPAGGGVGGGGLVVVSCTQRGCRPGAASRPHALATCSSASATLSAIAPSSVNPAIAPESLPPVLLFYRSHAHINASCNRPAAAHRKLTWQCLSHRASEARAPLAAPPVHVAARALTRNSTSAPLPHTAAQHSVPHRQVAGSVARPQLLRALTLRRPRALHSRLSWWQLQLPA